MDARSGIRSGVGRRGAVRVLAVALGVMAVAAAGVLASLMIPRGVGLATPVPTVSGSIPSGPSSVSGTTGLVARIAVGQFVPYSWSPDGSYLLVRSYGTDGKVYDRAGREVASVSPLADWLDSGHLIDTQGNVAAIADAHQDATESNSHVVANGHGSAAIVVAMPACPGDPYINWYRDGAYQKSNEQVTPFGWSPDGKLALLGHYSCDDPSGSMNWQGTVDVVDFGPRKVLATATHVRGKMALNPSATRLATQSGADVQIVDVSGGPARVISGATLLGWKDDGHVYYIDNTTELLLADVTGSTIGAGAKASVWQIPSVAGPFVEALPTGAVTRVVAADGKTTLLDLANADLTIDRQIGLGSDYARLWTGPWSPDGRMVVLQSRDGTSLSLFSIDPSKPGAIGTALPTPVGSPRTLAVSQVMNAPVALAQFVADTKRDAFWGIGGALGSAMMLYRFDAGSKVSIVPIEGLTYDPAKHALAIGHDGRVWVGSGTSLVIFDPDAQKQTRVSLPTTGASIQTDPALGRADPWIAGIAFDAKGDALIARNWVSALIRVDASLAVMPSAIEISDGFAMTGGIVVAGGAAYVVADPVQGLVLGADATGADGRAGRKLVAPAIAACGDKLLTAGTPPGINGPEGGEAMIEPVMASADMVAGGPGGCALYDSTTGSLQLRGVDGHVTGQGVFPPGKAPHILALAIDAKGAAWALETTADGSAVVRLDAGN